MNLRLRRKYKLMFLLTVLMVSGIVVIKYSGAFNLTQINTIPDGIVKEAGFLSGVLGMNIFSFPEEAIADSLLDNRRILSADLNYKLPDKIEIRINDVKPLALIVSADGNSLYILDDRYYLKPFTNDPIDFNFPIITGVKNCKPYRLIDDYRLALLAEQIKLLRDEDYDFYMALSSIDISKTECITIVMDGLRQNLQMYAGDLCQNMKYLQAFLLEFNPDLSAAKTLDMRSRGQIIASK